MKLDIDNFNDFLEKLKLRVYEEEMVGEEVVEIVQAELRAIEEEDF